jgi:hypothetical protein
VIGYAPTNLNQRLVPILAGVVPARVGTAPQPEESEMNPLRLLRRVVTGLGTIALLPARAQL